MTPFPPRIAIALAGILAGALAGAPAAAAGLRLSCAVKIQGAWADGSRELVGGDVILDIEAGAEPEEIGFRVIDVPPQSATLLKAFRCEPTCRGRRTEARYELLTGTGQSGDALIYVDRRNGEYRAYLSNAVRGYVVRETGACTAGARRPPF